MSQQSLPVEQDTAVARPLRELVPKIKEEIELGWAAGLEHYLKAGEMLVEAKAQLAHGEWLPWLKRNFKLSIGTAQSYMRLAQIRSPLRFSTLSAAVQPNRPAGHHSRWEGPVRLPIHTDDIDRMMQERLSREHEARLTRELGLQLIRIGYKALAEKLHPDKGGSTEGMARLNRVRDVLKRATNEWR